MVSIHSMFGSKESRYGIKTEDMSDITGELEICAFCPSKIIDNVDTVLKYDNNMWQLCNYCTLIKSELFKQFNEAECGNYFCSYCLASELKFKDLVVHLRRHLKMETCQCLGESHHIRDFKVEIKEECLFPIMTSANNIKDISTFGYQNKGDKPCKIALKPFNCDHCDYKTTQNYNLKIHMRKHTGERPFNCDHCDYKTAQNCDLKRHMRKQHTGERLFYCDHCDYKAAQNYHLKIHMRKHTGERPFNCDHCDYKAARNGDLKRHMRKHTGEKPFHCDRCDRKFAQNSTLKSHIIQKHTGEKPFHCDHCNLKECLSKVHPELKVGQLQKETLRRTVTILKRALSAHI